MSVQDFLQIDLPAVLIATLVAVPCALLGSFLILRRQALLGDSLSHAVWPGIVAGFLLTGSISPLPMMIGALIAAGLAVMLIDTLQRKAQIDHGAAMAVVFPLMFALGVVMLEVGVGSRVHLDVQHALYGTLETLIWPDANQWNVLFDPSAWGSLPGALKLLVVINILVLVWIVILFKELQLTSFDAQLATCLGISPQVMSWQLVVMVAVTAVAAFEAVGAILVIAMFICPAASARMITDRLPHQLSLSVGFAVISSVLGYGLAVWVPLWSGWEDVSFAAAAMIVCVAGLIQTLMMLFAPRYGSVRRRITP